MDAKTLLWLSKLTYATSYSYTNDSIMVVLYQLLSNVSFDSLMVVMTP